MSESYATLLVTEQTNPLGIKEKREYQWEGKSPYVRVSLYGRWFPDVEKINGDKEIQIGPYRLLQIDDGRFYSDYLLYVRKDKFGALRVWFYKATRLLDLIYRRAIITLAVWRLADYHEATVPTWRDIKFLKRHK